MNIHEYMGIMGNDKCYVVTKQSLPEASAHCIAIDSLDKLPFSGCYCVILDFSDTAFDVSLISQLRQRPHYQLLPVFYLGNELSACNELLDGMYDESSSAIANAIHAKMNVVHETHVFNDIVNDLEPLVLSYLYVRENYVLRPKLDFHQPSGFQYPLLTLFGFTHSAEQFWHLLEGMETRKLLKHQELMDEIQCCPQCSAGLLNFKNCCPNCNSVHIDVQPFVHCFACGNMGPLSEFIRNEEMICNRCHVKLRHIGIDYDKPMEDKICQDCKHYFFEFAVNAICMVCSKLTPPENLQTKKLYAYSLAARGQSVAKGIDQHVIVELEQFIKIIDHSVFLMIVKWQSLLVKRYKSLFFSLICLVIKNEDALIAQHGITKTENVLIEFFDRIRSLVRDTDWVTRDDKAIFFYLPMTPSEGCAIIFERIQSFVKHSSDNMVIEIGLSMITSQEILESNLVMDLIFTELYNRI